MWRSYLASALGGLTRDWLYAAINIAGLALGVAAALLIALFIRDELTFDRSFPGYSDVYLLTGTNYYNHQPVYVGDGVFPDAASKLKLEFPEVAAVARVMSSSDPPRLRHGQVEDWEAGLDWVDPTLFDVLPMKAVAGDPRTALRSPDAVVLTRAAARKYFGRDAPIGETLEVDPAMGPMRARISPAFNAPHPMRVAAVVEDLPSNSSLKGEVFASGLAPFSIFALWAETPEESPFRESAFTYVQLKPGASVSEVEKGLAPFSARHFPPSGLVGLQVGFHMTPIAALHFASAARDEMTSRGDPKVLAALGGIGLLIVVSASINFVTLMTARAGRRAVETGVRKAVGAHRSDLIVQFLGEAVVYVALAMVLGVVLAELLLPLMSAALNRTIVFDYLHDPALAAALIGATVGLGLLAGAYPAFVMSAFRPAAVLKGGWLQGQAGSLTRQALVMLQFAIMIGLVVTAATLYRQTLYALNDRLRVDASKFVTIREACLDALDPRVRAFREQVANLPGVEASACTSTAVMVNGGGETAIRGDSGLRLGRAAVGVGALELVGIEPLAGRFFSRSHGEDQPGASGNPPVVLSESAVRRLGFAAPAAAVGRVMTWTRGYMSSVSPMVWTRYTGPSEIIGVAPDFDFDARTPMQSRMFYVEPLNLDLFAMRLNGANLPETLRAIDRAWYATGHSQIHRRFLDQTFQDRYAAVILQGTAISLGAGLALVIAALGLFGLAAHAAEQRTKEIGVRKAMGASTADIVRLLLWQFSRPVLWANLIAWPLAWWAMSRWLSGFAYHVDLPLWLFLAAGGSALLIACATVLAHALMVARAEPATALRYE